MSAPHTNAAIAEAIDWTEKHFDYAKGTHFADASGEWVTLPWARGKAQQAFIAGTEAIAALREEPPALPAEVEAVVLDLHDACVNLNYEGACGCCGPCKAATLLRRYAQSVAEKDAEIARLTEAHRERAGVAVEQSSRARAAEKKLQAVEALCANARRRDRVIYPGEILDILEWT